MRRSIDCTRWRNSSRSRANLSQAARSGVGAGATTGLEQSQCPCWAVVRGDGWGKCPGVWGKGRALALNHPRAGSGGAGRTTGREAWANAGLAAKHRGERRREGWRLLIPVELGPARVVGIFRSGARGCCGDGNRFWSRRTPGRRVREPGFLGHGAGRGEARRGRWRLLIPVELSPPRVVGIFRSARRRRWGPRAWAELGWGGGGLSAGARIEGVEVARGRVAGLSGGFCAHANCSSYE